MARQQYVVPPDGQRFLMNAATDAIDPPSITGVLNWKGKTCNKDVSRALTAVVVIKNIPFRDLQRALTMGC